MIGNYRKKDTIELCQWDGENKEEISDFVGKENIEFIMRTNSPYTPVIKTKSIEIPMEIGDYVDSERVVYKKNIIKENYEKIS